MSMRRRGVNQTYLIPQPFDSAPSAHYEWVVSGYNRDDVYTFRFELLVEFEEWREVVDMASWLLK